MTSLKLACEDNAGRIPRRQDAGFKLKVADRRKGAGVETVGLAGIGYGIVGWASPAGGLLDGSVLLRHADGQAQRQDSSTAERPRMIGSLTRQRYFALSSSTGTLSCAALGWPWCPRNMSARKRCPWVLIATRSQPFCCTHLMISFDRVAIGQFGLGRNAGGLKLRPHSLQIRGVFRDFRADRVRAIGPGRPSVGHVQQHQTAVRQLGQLLNVFDDRPVGRRAVQRHQNGVVHGRSVYLVAGVIRRQSPATPLSANPAGRKRPWR